MTRSFFVAAIAALLVAVPAAQATEYFYEDFEGDTSAWQMVDPNSTLMVYHFQGGAYGMTCNADALAGYDYATNGENPDKPALPYTKAEKAAAGPSQSIVGGVVWFSVDFRHTGGYPDPGGSTGWKTAEVRFLDANDNGIGIQWGGQRRLEPDDPHDASVRIYHDTENYGITGLSDAPGYINGDNWVAHRYEVKIDWTNLWIEQYEDGVLLSEGDIGWDYEADKTFNRVQVNFMQDWADAPSIDNIYVGDVRNPYTDPTIVQGDANSDEKVDILDLTALAGNWAQGGKMWTEGDFNFDFTVDILDLTALAGNWNYGVTAGVPEPATMSLLAIAGVALLRRRR